MGLNDGGTFWASAELDAVKKHLTIDLDDTDDDEELQFWLDVATEWMGTQVSDLTPSPVQGAIRVLVAHLWDTQRGPAGTPLDDNELETVSGYSFAIPNRVKELIAPYMKSRTASAPVGSFPPAASWPDAVSCW